MLIVIEEVKVQLCQVNRELSTLELSIQDKDKQPDTLQNLDSEISTYTARQKQAKRDKFKLFNQDYQEGFSHPRRRLYTWPPRKPFRNDRFATSDSDHPTENPSTDSDSRKRGPQSPFSSFKRRRRSRRGIKRPRHPADMQLPPGREVCPVINLSSRSMVNGELRLYQRAFPFALLLDFRTLTLRLICLNLKERSKLNNISIQYPKQFPQDQ